MSKDKVVELERVLKKYEGQKILIALRGAPDPDCISSALAHQRILKSKNIESIISHVHEISHQENKALVKLIGAEMVSYSPDMDFPSFSGYSVLDAQTSDEEFIQHLLDKPLISVVDHHDHDGEIKADFVDIRKTVNATATIYTEYLHELNLLDNSDESQKIATALMNGIRSDTEDLLNASRSDYNAVASLSPYVNLTLLRQISLQRLSTRSMDLMVKAYEDKQIFGSYILSGVGVVKSSERDSIPQSADFLLQREGIHTVLVYGVVDNVIDCSFRTSSDTIRPADFIRKAFSDVETHGKYGGRYDKGGFRLKLGPVLSGLLVDKQFEIVCNAVTSYMRNRFKEAVGEKDLPNEES